MNDLLEVIDWLIGHMPFSVVIALTRLSSCPPLVKERIQVLSKPKKEKL